jgi:hypothetical protein
MTSESDDTRGVSLEGADASSEGGNAFPDVEEAMLITHIFETGLRTCSPKVLLSMMPPSVKQTINSEHVKSRLQKYRNNEQRSRADLDKYYKEEFKDSFVKWLKENPSMTQEELDNVRSFGLVHAEHMQARPTQSPSEPLGATGNLRGRSANGTVVYPSRTMTLIDKQRKLAGDFAELQGLIASQSKQFDTNMKELLDTLTRED